jgi:DMSO/TMAO reductase YedYZ molybdopterin-dependent catalytic subunit
MNEDAMQMNSTRSSLSRRRLLQSITAASSAAALALLRPRAAIAQDSSETAPEFTGPGPNPYWNAVGEIATFPQKAPLIMLTDRPPQLETPRHYFANAFTPNEAFFVRWHLQTIPNAVDLREWLLRIEGNVEKPLALRYSDLATRFAPVNLAAVDQCSGNSRSRLQPRVAGGQWGNGAMGNALWTGVKLRDLLNAAILKSGSVQIQLEGLDKGLGPEGYGSNRFMKALDLANPVIDECIVAYAMNNAPLPMLNGFPVRLIVPGYFATYWLKSLSWIRVLEKPDDNYWMKTAYRIPDTPRGSTSPEDMKAGKVNTIPIAQMPVRSFLISPDGSAKIPVGLPLQLRGIAFSGYGAIKRVEVSDDNAATWRDAPLGEDHGPYSFRTWSLAWTPRQPGTFQLAVRATDAKGHLQTDEGVWNPGGYLWNKIERTEIVVGEAS